MRLCILMKIYETKWQRSFILQIQRWNSNTARNQHVVSPGLKKKHSIRHITWHAYQQQGLGRETEREYRRGMVRGGYHLCQTGSGAPPGSWWWPLRPPVHGASTRCYPTCPDNLRETFKQQHGSCSAISMNSKSYCTCNNYYKICNDIADIPVLSWKA